MKQLIKPNVLRIDRAKWRTGDDSKHTTGKGETKLLNKSGYMCCLGFFCNQAGVSKVKLREVPTPDGIKGRPDVPVLVMGGHETDVCRRAMNLNDDENIKPLVRENKLKALFKKSGVKVVITGKYKKNPILD